MERLINRLDDYMDDLDLKFHKKYHKEMWISGGYRTGFTDAHKHLYVIEYNRHDYVDREIWLGALDLETLDLITYCDINEQEFSCWWNPQFFENEWEYFEENNIEDAENWIEWVYENMPANMVIDIILDNIIFEIENLADFEEDMLSYLRPAKELLTKSENDN